MQVLYMSQTLWIHICNCPAVYQAFTALYFIKSNTLFPLKIKGLVSLDTTTANDFNVPPPFFCQRGYLNSKSIKKLKIGKTGDTQRGLLVFLETKWGNWTMDIGRCGCCPDTFIFNNQVKWETLQSRKVQSPPQKDCLGLKSFVFPVGGNHRQTGRTTA